MVGEATLILHARSTLSVFLQQLSNNTHRILSCVGSLESKPVKLQGNRFMFCLWLFLINLFRTDKSQRKKKLHEIVSGCYFAIKFPFAPRDEHSLASGSAVEIQTTLFAGSLPDKIHAQESLLTIRTVSAPHCLISNAHLMLICAHLCPPQPCWFAQHHRICVGDLLNLYVGTLPGQTRDRGKVC